MTWYGQPRIIYNPGSGDQVIDFPLTKGIIDLDRLRVKKSEYSMDLYPDIESRYTWYVATLDFSYVQESKVYSWTDNGVAKTFTYMDFWTFWTTHAEDGKFFDLYPHYPFSLRPPHWPAKLTHCHTDQEKFNVSREKNLQGRFPIKFQFKGEPA